MECRPTEEQAIAAMREVLAYIGEDPDREGLLDTPRRFLKAMRTEWCGGYGADVAAMLDCNFSEVAGYRDMVVEQGIRFESHCEHHLAPIIGVAHVGYIPMSGVVGISKLARVVDAFAKRLQIQERMTNEIAKAIDDALRPVGVMVVIQAEHQCMTTRGVHKPGTLTTTRAMRGRFETDQKLRDDFMALIRA